MDKPPLSKHQYLWCFIFWVMSLWAWLLIYLLPKKFLNTQLGQPLANPHMSVLCTEQQRLKARRIGRSMKVVSAYTPWPCECLSQALCVKWLLNYYGIPSVLILGALLGSDEFKAHAWLCVGKTIVVGEKGYKPYQLVAAFLNKGPL